MGGTVGSPFRAGATVSARVHSVVRFGTAVCYLYAIRLVPAYMLLYRVRGLTRAVPPCIAYLGTHLYLPARCSACSVQQAAGPQKVQLGAC